MKLEALVDPLSLGNITLINRSEDRLREHHTEQISALSNLNKEALDRDMIDVEPNGAGEVQRSLR